MEIGVLGFSGSKNIGDYIQTKAVIDILNTQNIKILDRENIINQSVISAVNFLLQEVKNIT